MTKYVELLKKDLLEKGMISENLPDFINTNGISKIKFKELKKSGKYSSPITINIMKDDGGDRIISLPNPVSYQQLVKTMFSSEKMIKKVIEKIEKNKFSHSKIISDIDQLFDMPIKKINLIFLEVEEKRCF